MSLRNDYFYTINIFVLNGLAIAYGTSGNYDMAFSYYHKGIPLDIKANDQKQLSYVYRYVSRMYKQIGNMDSCLFYAQKALSAAYTANNSKEKLASYKLLAKTYAGVNDHTAVQYFNKESVLSDSIHSAEKNKEVENLNFNERERQQQLAQQERKAGETRKENLQLSAIALFIPLFFLAILWLSRTKTDRRIIEFMSVLSLLLVFEFVSLLIHPWIERLTGNSPVRELFILVALAAMLVPLHHNLSHVLKERLVHRHIKEHEHADVKSDPEL